MKSAKFNMKRGNPVARSLRSGHLRARVVRNRKTYSRKGRDAFSRREQQL